MKLMKTMKLKGKILSIIGAGILVLFLMFTLFVVNTMMSMVEAKQKEEKKILCESIYEKIEQKKKDLTISVLTITNNVEVQRLFAARDRQKLYDLLRPAYLANKSELSQFHFHLPESVSFLRLNSWEKFGDNLKASRMTVNQCNALKKIFSGIELGGTGYGIRVVAPMFYQDKHTGSFELGSNLGEELIKEIKKGFGGEYFIYTLEPEKLKALAKGFTFENGMLAGTLKEDQWSLNEAEVTKLKKGETISRFVGKNELLLLPIKNFQNEALGYFKIVIDRQQYFAEIAGIKFRVFAFSILAALLSIAVLYFLIENWIINPLNLVKSGLNSVAHNDLTTNVKYEINDELGEMASNLNNTVVSLRKTLGNVNGVANAVTLATKEIALSGEQMGSVSSQVSYSVQTVASGAEEQSNKLGRATNNIKELNSKINEVGRSSREMINVAENLIENVNRGNEALRNSVTQINMVKVENEEIIKIANSLVIASSRITEVTDMINSIAEQTKMLALNATIEAARAGEFGKGFQVVAEEISKLSEKSMNEGTQTINSIVNEIQNGISQVTKRIKNGACTVDSSVEAINEMIESFDKIATANFRLQKQIEMVMRNTEVMVNNSREVNDVISEITIFSLDLSSNAEEVAACSQEQTASIQEIIASSKQLAVMMEDLYKSINVFQLAK